VRPGGAHVLVLDRGAMPMTTTIVHTCDICQTDTRDAAFSITDLDQRKGGYKHEQYQACSVACRVKLCLRLAGVPGAELENVSKGRPYDRPDLEKRIAELEEVIRRTPPARSDPPPVTFGDLHSLVMDVVDRFSSRTYAPGFPSRAPRGARALEQGDALIRAPQLTSEAHQCFDSGVHPRGSCPCSCSWCQEWNDRDRAQAVAPSTDRVVLVAFDTGPEELVPAHAEPLVIGPAYPPHSPFVPTSLQIRRGYYFEVEAKLGALHMPYQPLRMSIVNLGAEPARFMAVLSGHRPDPGFLEMSQTQRRGVR
jgi:hypothetical protein